MDRNELHARILSECEQWLGTPYIHQASAKQVGCDCLGLLRGVWRAVYGHEPEIPPPYSPDWGEFDAEEPLFAAACRHLEPVDALVPAHIVLFRWRKYLPAKHVAIMTGQINFIHAFEHSGVTRARLNHHWKSKIAAIFRFPLPDQIQRKQEPA